MNGVTRLTGLKINRYPSCFVSRISLYRTSVDRQRFQAIQCHASQVISANAAQQHGVIA
jgi:hypothetical protein